MTFGVIVATLVGQGLTLPAIIRWLRVTSDDALAREEAQARLAAAQAALDRLDALMNRGDVPPDMIEDLRTRYARRAEWFDGERAVEDESRHQILREVIGDLLDAERCAIIDLRDRNIINDTVLRRIQHELDLEQVRLEVGM